MRSDGRFCIIHCSLFSFLYSLKRNTVDKKKKENNKKRRIVYRIGIFNSH